MNLTQLQKDIDRVFTGSEYRTRQARENSGGFFISCPTLTKSFISWLENAAKCVFKNVQYDNEHPEYVKAFFLFEDYSV